MEYRCKNCGGELHYDPASGQLKCPFCGSSYEISEYEETIYPGAEENPQADQDENGPPAFDTRTVHRHVHAMDDTTDIQDDLRAFGCPHCGAEIITDKDTVATQCIFCHTPMVIQEQVEGKYRPAQIIPFEVDRRQIEQIYEDYIRNKPFYPPEYSRANVIEKIRAIYLPFWLYDLNLNGTVQATGEHTMTFTTSDYIVTDHHVFAIGRDGSMDFEKIPVIASSKTPKDAMDSIEPFDYSRMVAYSPGYLPGFLAQRYDQDDQAMQEFSLRRARQSFEDEMMATMDGYQNLRLTGTNARTTRLKADYVLLPAYLLFMDYENDEDKLIAINGQTGKIVGNIPVDRHKRNRYFLSRFMLFLTIFLMASLAILLIID